MAKAYCIIKTANCSNNVWPLTTSGIPTESQFHLMPGLSRFHLMPSARRYLLADFASIILGKIGAREHS